MLDMTRGMPLRLTLIFAVPLFIGTVFQQVYNVVDTMVAGYCLSDQAIAAIGATGSLYGLIINLSWGLNSGFALVITRSFGARDIPKLRKTIAATLILGLGITTAMTAAALIFLQPMMGLLHTPETIFDQAYSYMIVICGGLIATVAYNSFAAIMRSFGNSRVPLYILIFSSLLNIGLDLLFVAVFEMGVADAALATVLAQAISAVSCGAYVIHNYQEYLPRRKGCRLEVGLIREMLSSGGAMAFMYSIVCIGSAFYQSAINALGEVIITAHTSSERIIHILMGPLAALMDATSTFVGQNWGAGRIGRVKEAFRKSMLLEIVLGLTCCGLVYACGGQLIRLITGTKQEDVLRYGIMNMRIVLPFFPVLGVLFILRTSMQAMGQKIVPVISSVFELLMRVAGALWMVPELGYLGGCWNTPLIWSVMTMFIFIAYLVKTRKLLEDRAKHSMVGG